MVTKYQIFLSNIYIFSAFDILVNSNNTDEPWEKFISLHILHIHESYSDS